MTIHFDFNEDLIGTSLEEFRADFASGLEPHFDGTVSLLPFPIDPTSGDPIGADLRVLENDVLQVVPWKFVGRHSEPGPDGQGFRGVLPQDPPLQVEFCGCHLIDRTRSAEHDVQRFVDEGILLAQLGLVVSSRAVQVVPGQ